MLYRSHARANLYSTDDKDLHPTSPACPLLKARLCPLSSHPLSSPRETLTTNRCSARLHHLGRPGQPVLGLIELQLAPISALPAASQQRRLALPPAPSGARLHQACMQSEHDLAAQSGFSPVHAPATPSNGRQATPSSSTSQTLQLTPSQAEGLAQLGLSALIPNNTTFSPDSVVSPQSPAYSQNSGEMNGVGTMSPYYAGTPASGVDPNTRMVPRALNMDIDLSAFPPSPHSASAHSASGSSTGAATPGTNALRTPYYYPPAGTPVHPPHPTVQRHHPYAHPAHPPRSSQPPSSSALPLYLTTPASAPPTAPTSSASDIPPSAPIASPASNGAFSPSVADPPAVQRVHSAPAHILTLSNGVQDGEGGPSSAMDEGGAPPFGGATAQEWDPNMATPQMSGAGASGTPQGVSGDWQMEQGHARPPELVKQEESQPGFFDGSFAYAQGQPVFTQQQQAPPPPPQQHHVPQPPPPTPMSAIQLVDAVSAIALLRNRLPIMEAALSTSASDPGGDEEEIWKGVEGAYGELKRIMMSRKDARRGLGRSGTLKAATNRGYSMDLEAPNTPMESRPPSSTSTFLNVHSHPPLLHSQSSPDVPTVSNAQRAAQAAQQAQDVANAQAVIQRQQAAMQQAQLQQQQQQQLQQQMQQAEAQARADAEGRARAEAEQRARAEDESRLKIEAEAQARADAEAAEAAARRDQQEQYERAVAQQQQHQQQQAIAQQQQQQQQQQQLQMHQMQEEHFRHQHEQQMRNQQMAEAQAHAQQPADAQQQQQQQFNAPTDFSLTPQPQLNSVTPQAITNPPPAPPLPPEPAPPSPFLNKPLSSLKTPLPTTPMATCRWAP
ncbi:hypothetical protein BCR35DRAFT_315190 [Leucosporidium creatinivorum]|uniref:Uncharacterized protein n=1 Tax=Leucosporidium creatinivorum TaxID=106004 RepID=A0A1Y2EL57_9BASI|nr:hypothetical protein BCR35DRAFT_315190 [Leucosporidium creatinivorum]